MGSARFLPLQVAAVCYRKCGASFEFLLVNTTSGDRWIFPKGATARQLSHSQAAEREALEEAGAVGVIEPQHFHLYLQPKGVSRLRNGIQEFVVKAFLLQVSHTRPPQEQKRNPTDRKSTRLNSSHVAISYAVFCLKKKKKNNKQYKQ